MIPKRLGVIILAGAMLIGAAAFCGGARMPRRLQGRPRMANQDRFRHSTIRRSQVKSRPWKEP